MPGADPNDRWRLTLPSDYGSVVNANTQLVDYAAIDKENWHQLEQWANNFGLRQLVFMDIIGDGTQTSYTRNVPTGYTNIRLRLAIYPTIASTQNIGLQMNGDTGGSSYLYEQAIVAFGGTWTFSNSAAASLIPLGNIYPDSNRLTLVEATIALYGNTTYRKAVNSTEGQISGVNNANLAITTGIWNNTSAITSLTVSLTGASNFFATGSRLQAWVEF